LDVGWDKDAAEMRVDDVWSPLPVTDAMADFLALGCQLPGEARITSAFLNAKKLRPIKLTRVPIDDGSDFNVAVAKDSLGPNLDGAVCSSSMKPTTPWLQHQSSHFRGVKSTDIEANLNACARKDKTLLDSLKKRQLAYPLINDAPLVP